MLKYNVNLSVKALAALTVASTLMIANSANAVTFSQTGTIEVLPALGVAQSVGLNFGQVAIPSSGTETVIVTIDNTTGGGSVTYLDNTVADGEFDITGSTSNTISISATGTDADGIVWTAITGNYNGGTIADLTSSSSVAAPGTGTTLKVGATITVSSGMSEGTYSPAYDLDIAYD